MECVCGGMTNIEIAELHHLTHVNVKKIVDRMVRDMGAKTTRQACYIWGTGEVGEDPTVEQLAKRLARISMESAMRRLEHEQAG